MARFKKIQQERTEGKIVYGNNIVDNIVCLTVNELPFVELFHKVSGKKKNAAISVYLDKKNIDVDISIKIHYTQRVPDIVFKIQEAVRHNIESMTEYKINSVNVIVMGVLFDEENSVTTEKQDNIDSTETTESQKDK